MNATKTCKSLKNNLQTLSAPPNNALQENGRDYS